jgi:hypothetical protein
MQQDEPRRKPPVRSGTRRRKRAGWWYAAVVLLPVLFWLVIKLDVDASWSSNHIRVSINIGVGIEASVGATQDGAKQKAITERSNNTLSSPNHHVHRQMHHQSAHSACPKRKG